MLSYGALRGDRDHRVWIAGAISTLLRFYWTDEPNERQDAIAGQWWADDLEAFPQPVIAAAINEWRRGQSRRPTPHDMIQLCGKHMHKAPAEIVPLPERQRVTKEQADAILAERGFSHLVKRIQRSGEE
jgi:hypothetical protein